MNLFYETPGAKLYLGDSRHLPVEDDSIDMIATSPPYWGKRDYGQDVVAVWGGEDGCEHRWAGAVPSAGWRANDSNPGEMQSVATHKRTERLSNYCSLCGAWRGQLGLEPTWQEYISHLCECAEEWWRVLRPTGNLFVNIGDTFHGGKGRSGHGSAEYQAARQGISINKPQDHIAGPGLTRPQDRRVGIPKMKLGIPFRLRFALNDMGWVSRDDIIWYKGKEYPDGKITKVAMPESVKDRMSCSYEMVFHFVKEPKGYFFDLDSIRTPHIYGAAKFNIRVRDIQRGRDKGPQWKATDEETALYDEGQQMKAATPSAGANPGDVWIIQPEPFKEKHYACWPSKLCERMIKAGCPKEVCPKCGKPRERIVESGPGFEARREYADGLRGRRTGAALDADYRGIGYTRNETIGWSDCGCGEGFVPGVVVDPFFGGSYRIAKEALKLGRNVIGIDMKEEYLEMAKDISIYGEKGLTKEKERREKVGMSQAVLL